MYLYHAGAIFYVYGRPRVINFVPHLLVHNIKFLKSSKSCLAQLAASTPKMSGDALRACRAATAFPFPNPKVLEVTTSYNPYLPQ
jgi:hypothetical protein